MCLVPQPSLSTAVPAVRFSCGTKRAVLLGLACRQAQQGVLQCEIVSCGPHAILKASRSSCRMNGVVSPASRPSQSCRRIPICAASDPTTLQTCRALSLGHWLTSTAQPPAPLPTHLQEVLHQVDAECASSACHAAHVDRLDIRPHLEGVHQH